MAGHSLFLATIALPPAHRSSIAVLVELSMNQWPHKRCDTSGPSRRFGNTRRRGQVLLSPSSHGGRRVLGFAAKQTSSTCWQPSKQAVAAAPASSNSSSAGLGGSKQQQQQRRLSRKQAAAAASAIKEASSSASGKQEEQQHRRQHALAAVAHGREIGRQQHMHALWWRWQQRRLWRFFFKPTSFTECVARQKHL
ncbi:hypothetical protein VPH35_092155 [Triticum aestivum]